ncbi:MAG TPA: AraC family transcriptional regulator [Sphingomonadaceae bacterium]|nr:AraC family transcriptional regulator [Sphingomonadaceae bacterium]
MNARAWDKQYDSYATFYEDAYAPSLLESYAVGRAGAGLLISDQDAGDWSDAATPDLVIARSPATPSVGATLDLGGGRFSCRIPANAFIVSPPNFATTILIDCRHRIEALALPYARLLEFAGDPAESGLPADGDFGRLHKQVNSDASVSAALDRLWEEARAGAPCGTLAADASILQLAAALLALRARPAPTYNEGGLAPWQVRRVCDYLSSHLDHDHSLAELAGLIDLSTFHFCRAFKRSTGTTPHAWLTHRRVERAKDVMSADSDVGLTEVALSVGYGSQSAFGTAFRRVTGTTPSAWRRERLS